MCPFSLFEATFTRIQSLILISLKEKDTRIRRVFGQIRTVMLKDLTQLYAIGELSSAGVLTLLIKQGAFRDLWRRVPLMLFSVPRKFLFKMQCVRRGKGLSPFTFSSEYRKEKSVKSHVKVVWNNIGGYDANLNLCYIFSQYFKTWELCRFNKMPCFCPILYVLPLFR